MFLFASKVLAAQHRLTISLGYLAGAVVGGGTLVRVDDVSTFGNQCWNEVIARSWQERLDLYRRIPAAGTSWGGSVRATHMRQAAEVERKLLRDTGFTIQSNDARPDTKWAFRRSGTEAMFEARWQQLVAEGDLRDDTNARDETTQGEAAPWVNRCETNLNRSRARQAARVVEPVRSVSDES